ncbi:MAG TPA: type II toxin-antitoxin system HicB family antitoxin [Dehalococcoidia bacterium]|nr:type II toxin-antitoxin system HicB family antitoxin [Dehalococcoidia bacterium]
MSGTQRVYTVIVHKAEEGGYWTSVPALPGAGSQGETVDEALDMTRESIELMIEALTEDGKSIPEDADAIETIRRVAVPS